MTALAVMGLLLWLGVGRSGQWIEYGFSQRILHLAALVVGGACVYFAALWLLGFRLHQFKRSAA
jgi:putative peptidoglycan lipid II flippase